MICPNCKATLCTDAEIRSHRCQVLDQAPNPKPSLRERIDLFWRRYYNHRILNYSEIEAFAKETEAEAYARGRMDGLEEAASLMEPHKPNCRGWECGNCTRANSIRALKDRKG